MFLSADCTRKVKGPQRPLYVAQRCSRMSSPGLQREGLETRLLQTQRNRSTMESLKYFSRKNASKILEDLHTMKHLEELCDVSLQTQDGVSVSAHRLVLCAASPYFKAMFTGNLLETHKRTVIIKDVDGNALEGIIQFIYTSSIDVDSNSVEDLLSASNLLQIKEIVEVCCEFLKGQLHPSNCLGITALADRFSCKELWSEAHKFTVRNFTEVCECEEFKALSADQVKQLLLNENVGVRSEEDVYKAALIWLNASEHRREYLTEVLGCVRLPVLSPTYLTKHVISNELLTSDPECKQMLDEAFTYASSPSSEKRKHALQPRLQPRVPSGFADVLVAVGGLHHGNPVSSAERYNQYTDEWLPTANMNVCRYGVAVTQLRGQVYCLGGHREGYLNAVECYTLEENTWSFKAPMLTAREYFGAACLCGKIYAVGGSNSYGKLKTVECFDPYENVWTYVAALTHPRMYVGVAALGGLLYVVGGHDGKSRLNSVECYDPQTNEWSSVAEMGKSRSVPGVAALNGLLYVVGGFDGQNNLLDVECYDPQTNSWMPVASLQEPRSAASVCVMKDKLYVAGGFNGQFLDTVEIFDPALNQWTYGATMSIPRVHFGMAVV